MTVDTTSLIFTGGGTGGHLFPAIAIANRVMELTRDKMKIDITFVGTKRGLEYRMRDSLGFPLYTINIRGIARSLSLKNLLVPFLAIGALIKAYLLLRRLSPVVVIGTGGYVCWPVLKVAAFKKITTVLQEQNSFPGLTTRRLAGNATKIFLGFEEARNWLQTPAEIIVTGNPVRGDIAQGDRSEGMKMFHLDPTKKTILVLGGSQGARAINEAILKSLNNNTLKENYQLLWQTGKRDYTDVSAQASNKAACSLFPFADSMQHVYAAADIVIARAGALTLAELAVCGLPSILVPYRYAAGDHQKKNATAFVDKGCARLLEEDDLDNFDIIALAIDLMESDQFTRMQTAVQSHASMEKPAVDIIANEIIELIKQKVG